MMHGPFGIPLNRDAWQEFDVAGLLAGLPESDQVRCLRGLVERVNRTLSPRGGQSLRPGELIVLTLIQEFFHAVAELHWTEDHPGLLDNAVEWVDSTQAAPITKTCADSFLRAYACDLDPPNTVEAVAEMAMLSLMVNNPAATTYQVLFGDKKLRAQSPYRTLVNQLEAFFAEQPRVRSRDRTLFSLLREPIMAHPTSLPGQLAYIIEHFGDLLPESLLRRLLTARGILREEEAERGLGPGPSDVLLFDAEDEPERFTMDRDWMANVVVMAKSTYVWLDQLSKQYQRDIHRLDQIPDEELDRLARWGFTGLWLIGLWERSTASEEIKRRMGNPEAVASAYSLFDYTVAHDLGGEEAYAHLAQRARERGIHLAADMVPNHVGIHSKWVIEHPEWFMQLDHPPFPGYRFTGPNLSGTPGVEIRIEDGYWNHSDAAVVFERLDTHTGQRRYIYHGNDGTSMPWNDTAQLDYLNPAVREAVIQTILHVARHFSVIRFDAAMTLARRHIQRLWYPAPGDGGAIPSRAERGMGRNDLHAAMPNEFWREVVDRVQAEQPDTLLLAEAFWLMEGYFVRTLGMHRVYNSAFMNMLKMEDNAKYRQTVKNVLEYSPQILKRFVNFMSNPDERTAVEQFGKEDKYFGCLLLMVTMPGLPMFAHGQVEGYSERYGMEYRRAYWDEMPDEGLVKHHIREIFPLMRRRYLFSQVEQFAMYDFVQPDGAVDENVFAYSNTAFGDRALVIYNNAYNDTRGWIRLSTAMNVGSVESPHLERRTLGDALQLNGDGQTWYVFRDHLTRLEYMRNGNELVESGLYVELGTYGRHVFLNWREIADADPLWVQLAQRLNGRGVPSVDEARRDLELEPLTDPFAAFVDAVRQTRAGSSDEPAADEKAGSSDEPAADEKAGVDDGPAPDEGELPAPSAPHPAADLQLSRFLEQAGIEERGSIEQSFATVLAAPARLAGLSSAAEASVAEICSGDTFALAAVLTVLRSLPSGTVEDWRLCRVVAKRFGRPELSELMPLLLTEKTDLELVTAARSFLLVNEHEGVEWFNAERMEALLEGQGASRAEALFVDVDADESQLDAVRDLGGQMRQAVEGAEFRLRDLNTILE